MKAKYLDLLGIYAAILCIIHCLFTPLFFLLPLEIPHNAVVDSLFLCLGIIPVYRVMRSESHIYLKTLLGLSFTTIVFAITLEEFLHTTSLLIYIGASGLVIGHMLNYKTHKYLFSKH